MDPRVKALFDALADKPHAEREEALAHAAADGCPSEVIAEVRKLLSIKTAESPTVASPDIDRVRAAAEHAAALLGDRAGEWIGPYRLLELIGEGGFGVVWLAERREPMVQRLAIKIIKPGMDSKAVIARFEQERQALAVMDHPNVAKVLDGGVTPSGRPYFVMEHVKGEPITSVADNHRLTIQQRLELFISVCDAVQHAHMKGIIHRDLKPSNILVTFPGGDASGDSSRGMLVKVIDFGVAKAISRTLTDKTIFTERGQIIGTPEYMSPEQAEMGAIDIDTRTDVYSLGVVLYELLCGALPFDSHSLRSAGYAEIQRIIREVDPPRPSTRLSTADDVTGAAIAKARHADREKIAKELRRELEWIPLKALRKDRRERYATPRDLAEDVQRYLKGDPLDAGPESTTYRLRKIMKRHRGPVLAAAAVFLVLVLGILGTWTQARRADRNAADQAAAAKLAKEQSELADAERQKAVAAAKTIEYNSYVANVQMAGAAMEMRLLDRVRQRLDACPAHLRGWEWGWLNATADTSLLVVKGNGGLGARGALSPDGTRIVTALWTTACVWDARTGVSLFELKGHTDHLNSAGFSPDGTRIVTASADKTARVWDAGTGVSLVELKGHTRGLTTATFSPDGTRIVTASWDTTVRVWDTATGASLAELEADTILAPSAAFSPDGTRVVTASKGPTSRVWDVATGTSLAELGGVSAAFSPDGTRIVTASYDNIARVWDAATGASLAELEGHAKWVTSAAFSPDGTRIVTASYDNTARVWDAATGASLAELEGHTKWVTSAAFSPDGTRIVTASDDNTARVWDAATGASLAELEGHTDKLISAAFSLEGARIVTESDDGTTRVWDASTDAGLSEFERQASYALSATFSPDGTRVVTASSEKTARVWDARTWVSLFELKGHTDHLNSAGFSPDGTRIVTASVDTTARVWDAETGAILAELKGHTYPVTSAAFSPDGTRIVTSSEDNTARVWDAATGVSLSELKGHEDIVISAAIGHGGARIVTTSWDSTARVWDTATGKSVAAFRIDPVADRSSAVFSADGTQVVILSACFAYVLDAANGTFIAKLEGSKGDLLSAAFNPNRTRIVTASTDNTARIWDAATGVSLAELTGNPPLARFAGFSRDGNRIVVASGDRTARVWESLPYRQRFPAIEAARKAEAKVQPIVASRLAAGDSLQAIRQAALANSSLPEVERRAYITVTTALAESAAKEAASLNDSLWPQVAKPLADPSQAPELAIKAERLLAICADDADQLNTVGVAFVRLGRHAEAIQVLRRAETNYEGSRRGARPSDWAFLAVAHWHLGRQAEARAALATFRTLAAMEKWNDNEEVRAWSKELDALIPPEP